MRKVRDAIRLVEQDGWGLVRTRGSHRQYRHPKKPGTVTIMAGKPGDHLLRGPWASVMKQAGLTEEEWLEQTRQAWSRRRIGR